MNIYSNKRLLKHVSEEFPVIRMCRAQSEMFFRRHRVYEQRKQLLFSYEEGDAHAS